MPHIHEHIDWVTGYYLVHDGKVYLVNHKRLGVWTCPGGHIELAEDPEQSLIREIKEETGLTPDAFEIVGSNRDSFLDREGFRSLPVPSHLNIHQVTATHRHIALQYFLRAKTFAATLNEQEHSAGRWFGETELDDPAYDIPPEIKFYAKEAIRLGA